jgi:hypothetical protein
VSGGGGRGPLDGSCTSRFLAIWRTLKQLRRARAEIHRYEATGIGKREFKIKRLR